MFSAYRLMSFWKTARLTAASRAGKEAAMLRVICIVLDVAVIIADVAFIAFVVRRWK